MGYPKWLFGLLIFCGCLLAADTYEVVIKGVKYRVTKLLGQGAVGTVFQAVDPDGNKVAIKILSAETDREMAAIAIQAELEKTQARGKTVGVLASGPVQRYQTSSIDSDDAVEFRSLMANAKGAVVMEKVDGQLEDIAAWFRLGGSSGQIYSFRPAEIELRIDHAFSLAQQMGDIWSGLVEKGYLYTDFKPINVGFTGNPPRVKLLDLGSLTTGPIDSNSPLDVRNKLVGTSDYRPPEMLKVKQATPVPGQVYNHYSDYFAIGRTLLAMYCGQCTPEQFEEILLSYAQRMKGPEHEAALAKMLFLSEFIKASQFREQADRERAIATSPILSKYFDISNKSGPRVALTEPAVLEVSRAALPRALATIEGRVRAKQTSWAPHELPVTRFLALPGEQFPEAGLGPHGVGNCNSQLRMLPYVAGALLVGGYAGWEIMRERPKPAPKPAPKK